MKEPSDNYEQRDVDTWRVGWVVAGFVGVLILCCLISAAYFKVLAWRTVKHEGPILSPLATRMREFPAPRLQAEPTRDLQDLRAREDALLGRYRWVDRQAGIVGMPVEVAMERLAEKGLPVGEQEGAPRLTWREVLQERAKAENRTPLGRGGQP